MLLRSLKEKLRKKSFNNNTLFDTLILDQLKRLGRELRIKRLDISKMLDKTEELGPGAGKLLDPKLGLYEVKSKKPPIRLYFKHLVDTDEIYVFE
ncbi:hypothetical protein BMS3Abin16_01278 [archaeon BMS3Abin16]|nr:hypothetical protein BMS3Abin16_01278 [archaeon BMS3Abin16]